MKKILLIILLCMPFLVYAAKDKKEEEVVVNKDIFLRVNAYEKIVLPEGTTHENIIFRSENEGVATVDEDGVIQGISSGETIVKAITIEGYEIEYNVKVATTIPYYWNKILDYAKKNLIVVVLIAVLGLVFIFIKLSY